MKPNYLMEIGDRLEAEFDVVAARASPATKTYPRNYIEGASIVSRIRGGPYGAETLRRSSTPRITVNSEARFADERPDRARRRAA